MNKITFLGAVFVSFNSFAFSLSHTQQFTTPLNAVHKVDFSGNWQGKCGDNDVSLGIVQDSKKITLEWKLDEDGFTDVFLLNAAESYQNASPTSNELYNQYANLDNNNLILLQYEVNASASKATSSLSVRDLNIKLIKEEDTLRVLDLFAGDDEICTFSK